MQLSSRVRPDTQAPDVTAISIPEGGIFFGGGSPDSRLYPSQALTQALETLLTSKMEALSYCRGQGDEKLRALIAQRAVNQGAPTTEDDVVVTAGSSGAFSLLADCLIDPGDLVFVEEFTYPGALSIFRQAGAEIVPVPMDGDGLDVDALKSSLSDLANKDGSPKLLYTIANNQSPTARNLTEDRRRVLVGLAEQFEFLILQDDTYGDVWYDGESRGSLRRYDVARTIHVGSFSKIIAPALRVGWFAGPPALADAAARFRADLGTSGLMQSLVASFMDDGSFDAHVEQVNASYKSKRDLVLQALEEHCGDLIQCATPPGGFFLWVAISDAHVADVEQRAFEEGVAFLSGSFFDVRGGRVVPRFRLAFGELPEPDLLEGAARLGRALRRCADQMVRS